MVVLEKQPEDTLFISEWLMSCRVLKRGMEEFIVDKILSVAAQQGFRRVVGEYIPTPKNAMVKDLYEQLCQTGKRPVPGRGFRLPLSQDLYYGGMKHDTARNFSEAQRDLFRCV